MNWQERLSRRSGSNPIFATESLNSQQIFERFARLVAPNFNRPRSGRWHRTQGATADALPGVASERGGHLRPSAGRLAQARCHDFIPAMVAKESRVKTIITHYIDGPVVESQRPESMAIVRPTDGQVIGRVTLADEQD